MTLKFRKFGGKKFGLLQYARTKKSAEKIAEKERRTGTLVRVIKNALPYKGYPYSIWVCD